MCHSQKYETKLSWTKPQTELPEDAPFLLPDRENRSARDDWF